jgi:hypothetical protein
VKRSPPLGLSLNTQTRIVLVAYVILAALSWVLTDLRFLLVPTALACLVLFLGGFAPFRPLRGALSLHWPSIQATDDPLGRIVIDGRECPFLGYDQELIATIRLRHLPELIASVFLPWPRSIPCCFCPSVGRALARRHIFTARVRLHCGLDCVSRMPVWFEERRLLGRSHYTIGTIVGTDPGFFRRGVPYQFFVPPAERRGGQGPIWGGRRQRTACLV